MKDIQDRIEDSPVGRIAVTFLIALFLLDLIAFNLPTSRVEDALARVGGVLRNTLGFDQAWGVFSNPPQVVSSLEATIRYDDGSTSTWRPRKGDPYVAVMRDYHWAKYAEYLLNPAQRSLWRPFALWLAKRMDGTDRHPIEVTLVRVSFRLHPPGSHPSRGPTTRTPFYTVTVGPATLSGSA